MVEPTRTKSTRVRKFLKKLAKESIPRFVSQKEAAVAPQKSKSRRQSLPQPVAGFELAVHSGRLDLNRVRTRPLALPCPHRSLRCRSLFARRSDDTYARCSCAVRWAAGRR